MSLIPFILDLADELHEFSRCLVNGIDINDFGFGLYTGTDQQQPQQHQQQQQQQQQQQPQTSPRRSRTSSFSSFWMPSKRHHPYNRIKTACCAKSGDEAVTNLEKSDTGSSSVGGTPGKSASYSVVNKNGFQVSMNVKQFAPNELSVKTIDNCIVVEGRHDDKEDGHGVISRHFVRKYMLPKGYDPNDVLSTLSSDGILTVKAPPPPPPAAKSDEPNERVIEIQPTPAPSPSPVLVVSAKETPVKETTKKLATSPLTRLDCQMPEKRQKLDLLPEPEPEESTETQLTILPAAVTENDVVSASTPAAGTEIESNDIEMEKADELTTENGVKCMEQQQQQQQTSNVEIENDVEKKAEIIEQAEKLLEREQEKILDETEKKLMDECISESNGDLKNVCVKVENSSRLSSAAKATEKINETPAEIKNQESVESVTKMDVDGENEGHNDDDEKKDNSQIVADTIKTADCETKAAVTPAANNVTEKSTNVDTEKNNDTDTSKSSTIATTTITTNTNTNNNNNSCTNRSSNSTDNTSPEVATENSANDGSGGNGVVTGEIPVDITNSADTAADTAATNKTKCLAAVASESVADAAEAETETSVLNTDKTANIIDDVALLKAATADPTTITDNTDENVILTESMDGITTTDLSTTDNTTTTTTTTTVDSVECSLFAKKTHLGNGNNTTATPIVGTEEMAN